MKTKIYIVYDEIAFEYENAEFETMQSDKRAGYNIIGILQTTPDNYHDLSDMKDFLIYLNQNHIHIKYTNCNVTRVVQNSKDSYNVIESNSYPEIFGSKQPSNLAMALKKAKLKKLGALEK